MDSQKIKKILAAMLTVSAAFLLSAPPSSLAAKRRGVAQTQPPLDDYGAGSGAFDNAAPKGGQPLPNSPYDNRGMGAPNNNFGSNPFMGGKGGKPADENMDDFADDEFDDINDEVLRNRMEQKLREKGALGGTGATPPAQNHGNDDPFANDTSASPTTFGGGSGGNPVGAATGRGGCLKLNVDTGYGPDVITNFDFPDADIVEIAKTLGRLTCLNFILDKDVKGRISIVSNTSITIGDAWKAFLTALDVNGFTVLPSGKYIRIARQRDAKDKQVRTYYGASAPDTDAMITRVIPLKYIGADEAQRVFRNLLPPTTRIINYDQTNTLIITDTGSNLKKIVDIIQLLDVEGYDEGLEVIKIRYASAEEIAKLIDQLLPGQPLGPPGMGAPGGGRFGARGSRRTKEGGVVANIIADGRTNSLIVNANAKGLAQVKTLVSKLDTRVTGSTGGNRIHVVYLQFAEAEQIANTLNNLSQGGGGKAPSAPGMGGGGNPMQTVLFEGNVKVAADKPTNSLVITASPTDFSLLKRVLGKLDVPRDQVYVETIIMELNLDKQFELSSSIASPKNKMGFLPNNDLASFLANPLGGGLQGLVLGFQGGKRQALSLGNNSSVEVGSVVALIKALQQNTNANILATPQILTLDNQEANIEIGETIPIPTTTAVQGAGTSQSFSREKISLSLKIKPQINKISSFVKLDITQKLDDISSRTPPKGVADFAFGTTTRSSQTTVVVQDQDTVVLGGLMKDKVEEVTKKIPLLGDIPLLGWLFRSKTTAATKTNLLAFITPRIIKQYQNIRKILDKKIQERDEFLEKYNGGDDPYQENKLKIIKDLPALSELKSGYRVDNADIDGEDDEEKQDSKVNNPGAAPADMNPLLPNDAGQQPTNWQNIPGINNLPQPQVVPPSQGGPSGVVTAPPAVVPTPAPAAPDMGGSATPSGETSGTSGMVR